jgi:hypothetical protein
MLFAISDNGAAMRAGDTRKFHGPMLERDCPFVGARIETA